jgi:raffinose/stachyose/melibiose transport system substrate-binding protein
MGMNSKSPNKADAKVFLDWLSSMEFANLYTNTVTGFFSLSNHKFDIKNPVAKEMNSWSTQCKSTIRLNAQIMNRGTPSMENALWNVGSRVMNLQLSPKDAATQIQNGFASWYKPGK